MGQLKSRFSEMSDRIDIRPAPKHLLRIREQGHDGLNDCLVLQDDDKIRETTELILSYNELQITPMSLRNYKYVKKLDLSHNRIDSFHAAITYLTNLEVLNLSYNCLRVYPKFMCRFRKLVSLDLRHNNLECIPTDILLMDKLKYLYIEGNENFVSVPKHIVAKGVTAIFAELRKRQYRKNEWDNWKPYHSRYSVEVRTLVERCVEVILDSEIEYESASIPTSVKNFIRYSAKYERPPVLIMKCSNCRGYFSNESLFYDHICSKKPSGSSTPNMDSFILRIINQPHPR